MAKVGSSLKDADADRGALFASLRRRWLLIFGGALVMAAVAWGICQSLTPGYRAETRILIEPREAIYAPSNGENATERLLPDPEGVGSQVEELSSGDLLKRVSGKFGLTGNEAFTTTDAKPWNRALILLGRLPDTASLSTEERVLSKMRRNLRVYNVPGSRVVAVQYASADPQLAATVANAIAGEYIALQGTDTFRSNGDATDLFAPEIDALRNRVRDAEKKVADYRASRGPLTARTNSILVSQQLSDVSGELARVRTSRASAEAKAESIRKVLAGDLSADSLSDAIASGMMQRLAERRMQLNAQIADLSITLLDGHPRIRTLRAQLASLDRQIGAEARKLLASLENAVTAARQREDELNRELSKVKAQAIQVGDGEAELGALEREAAAQRQLLETYLIHHREAASRTVQNHASAGARIVARADVPAMPYYPMTLPVVAATFAAGLLLLSIFVLLRELFRGRGFVAADGRHFEAVEEIEMPVIAAASPASEAGERFAATASRNPNGVEAIADRLVDGGEKRVVVVSPEGDEASAATVRLLRELADRGKRVVFVDMTAHGTVGLAMLDGHRQPGITELLGGEKRFNEIIHSDRFSQAHVVPLGEADPVEAMRSADRLPLILDALETVYDFIIVECGPSSSAQIRRVAEDGAVVVMSVIDPENRDVAFAALDLDQGGYEDVVILMDDQAGREPRDGGSRSSA